MKTFFIIPGFRMQAGDKAFKWLVSYLNEKGFKVVKVPVDWNYKTLSTNTKEFIEFYDKNKGNKNYILGFSYGAVISFLTADMLKPNKIFLCSLSPDFYEDFEFMTKQDLRIVGKRRFEDVKTRRAVDIAKKLPVPSVLFYGNKEGNKYPKLKTRAEETVKYAKNSKLIMVKDAPHDISHPEYILAVKKEIDNLL